MQTILQQKKKGSDEIKLFKIGDKVKYNGCFGPIKAYDGRVFEVSSVPWKCGDNWLIRLKDERGAVRADCLELESAEQTTDYSFYECDFCGHNKFMIKCYPHYLKAKCEGCRADLYIYYDHQLSLSNFRG